MAGRKDVLIVRVLLPIIIDLALRSKTQRKPTATSKFKKPCSTVLFANLKWPRSTKPKKAHSCRWLTLRARQRSEHNRKEEKW